jgi:hypothetical protein
MPLIRRTGLKEILKETRIDWTEAVSKLAGRPK